MLKKSFLFSIALFVFLSISSAGFAVNDVSIVDDTNFDILTADTAVATVISAQAGGVVSVLEVNANYIDITLDNLSSVTFNTAVAGNFLRISKQSGSSDYTILPTCPTSSAVLTGTGASVVLRLEVLTTDLCPSGGGGGGFIFPLKPETAPSEGLACARNEDSEVPFIDISTHWAESYIETLYRRCIVDGKTEAFFAPNDSANRAEVVKIMLNTYGIATGSWEDFYLDVFENDWFAPYVVKATLLGIVHGYIAEDGGSFFRPHQPITRAEALKIALEAKGVELGGYRANFADVSEGDWFYDYVAYAQTKDVIVGYPEHLGFLTINNFKPNNYITRAELAKIDLLIEAL